MAGTAPNIVLRKGTYYVRVQVPTDVQPILGKREFWESLRTSNFHDAKKAAPPIIAKFKREIAAARNSAYEAALTPAPMVVAQRSLHC